jgi:hypothetical protein
MPDNKAPLTQTLLLTYADGDQVYTRFNGTRAEATAHYIQNNFLTADYGAQVREIRFSPNDVYVLPISEDKRRWPGVLCETF